MSVLYVGHYGQGTLNLTSGGDVIDQFGIVGYNQGSVGQVNVSTGGGNQSRWIHNNYLTVGHSGMGTLNITDGGFVQSDTTNIGGTASGDGAVTVSGADSFWTTLGDVFVGVLGPGSVEMSAGGRAVNFNAYLGWNPGSTGEATVTGPGSEWVISAADLTVGNWGGGTMNVTSGAKVSSVNGFLGKLNGSTGTVAVSGAGSTWTNTGDLYVGNAGNGTLDIDDGATVVSEGGSIGHSAGSVGHVRLAGTSDWDGAGIVGNGGQGTLNILDGSAVGGAGTIGFAVGSDGAVRVEGDDSFLQNFAMTVGHSGHGSLEILAGGHVATSGPAHLANQDHSVGSVYIDGVGSRWEISGTLDMTVGAGLDEVATLSITNGGNLQVNEFSRTGTGEVVVNGAGSRWTSSRNIQVGFAGSTHLTVSNEAVIEAQAGLGMIDSILDGNGYIEGNVNNVGTVSPGLPIGALHIEGDYTQAGDGKLHIELASASAYDQLIVIGDAALAGTLELVLIDGFTSSPGDTYTILTANDFDTFEDVNGTFTTEMLPSLPNLAFDVIYNTQSVVLTVVSALPGDYNGNGAVDAADYVVCARTSALRRSTTATPTAWGSSARRTTTSGGCTSANRSAAARLPLALRVPPSPSQLRSRYWSSRPSSAYPAANVAEFLPNFRNTNHQ